ncbi:DUF551 domain-containing protein [Escherichia coli]|uniref:DUF551 domain-containing protein n=2 Tax=Escherichia coli TaxID=562 RepID=UPI00179422F3|nr:DUF551 domain-containing protein [Escherichia coli]EFF0242685.1 DUF551 domain-containing protein [Escherichia coli]ELG7497346.1 DUF551 domain-containing protein [Escherichia coli]EMA4171298.1 DUF551 domain-containing protein [Escherichia coli]MDM1558281.1 DUF551 domain-containing protein [Escherichia coli]MDM1631759.1 DUF551 domain-containing protein [Escherichia coli]
MTLTKEWLLKTIAELEEERAAVPGAVNEDAARPLAAMKLALTSLEAEPVACPKCNDTGMADSGGVQPWGEPISVPCDCTAQPALAVDADDNFYSWFGREWNDHYQQNQYTTAAKQMLGVMAESAWKAGRRAAMLQGAELVSNRDELPDGWVACSERMPEKTDEVLCAKEFDGPGDWRQKVGYYLAGKWTVYSASWTPTHWMPLPAAPRQEVK